MQAKFSGGILDGQTVTLEKRLERFGYPCPQGQDIYALIQSEDDILKYKWVLTIQQCHGCGG